MPKLHDVVKSFRQGDIYKKVLKQVSFNVYEREFISMVSEYSKRIVTLHDLITDVNVPVSKWR